MARAGTWQAQGHRTPAATSSRAMTMTNPLQARQNSNGISTAASIPMQHSTMSQRTQAAVG